LKYLVTLGALLVPIASSLADINITHDGSDGVLSVGTANRTVNLAAAQTAAWNAPGAGNGIYDPVKRAVVFKYSSVNIASTRTVNFINHPTRVPVVWLVTGNVVINGTVNLNGANGSNGAVQLIEPGPGGFRGGIQGGSGFGPGGGIADSGKYSSFPYGNTSIVPLIGGSGGGTPAPSYPSFASGGGGGAILIAAAGQITINGTIVANGGAGPTCILAAAGPSGWWRISSTAAARLARCPTGAS
jgi:hypothetical protein